MFQSVGHNVIELYAQALDVPLFRQPITGTSKFVQMNYQVTENDEVEDLFQLLLRVKNELRIDAVSTGAILSTYQRIRVENVCSRLGLKSLCYLWQQDQFELLQSMNDTGLGAILIKVAAAGLDPSHLGKSLADMAPFLENLAGKWGLNPCGEGGEYETLTLDCPLFKRRIEMFKLLI
jgi:diphthine-ammonia ligase